MVIHRCLPATGFTQSRLRPEISLNVYLPVMLNQADLLSYSTARRLYIILCSVEIGGAIAAEEISKCAQAAL